MNQTTRSAPLIRNQPYGIKPGGYKAVFFDAGNTLFQVRPSVGTVYVQTAEKFGFQRRDQDEELVEHYFREEWKQRSAGGRFDQGGTPREERLWWHGLVKAVFDRLGGMQQFENYFDYLYDLFATEAVWQLFPETLAVLDACRERGMVVGVVSNWDSRLFQICDGLGLTGKFDFIIASAVAGIAKPDPAIFHMALEKAGVEAHEAVHVGDSLGDDVAGARAAGMDVLMIDRLHDCSDHSVPAIDTLLAVLEIL